jgi:hypothetical protein
MMLVVLCSGILSGCFMRSMLGGFGSFPERGLIVTFGIDSNLAFCVRTDVEGSDVWNCHYTIVGSDEEGLVMEFTSTFELIEEFGFFGVMIDPLILQVPIDAHTPTGRFRYFDRDINQWVGPIPLVITETNSFDADASTTVIAEDDTTFLIVELPDDVIPDLNLQEQNPLFGTHLFLELEFELDEVRPIEVKPMLSVRIDTDDDTYYLPTAPCVTDFADVPAVQIDDQGLSPFYLDQIVSLILDQFSTNPPQPPLVCDGKVYNFVDDNGGEDPPPPPPPPSDTALIDVKPGSAPSPINPRSRGVTPVAILTTSVADGDAFDFDAASVEIGTLRFGPDGAHALRGSLEDVDGDGDLDLVVHFWTQETGIACGDTSVELTGDTNDGNSFTGTDIIRIVGCR